MNTLRKAIKLKPRELLVVFESLLLLPLVTVALRRRGFPPVFDRLSATSTRPSDPNRTSDEARRLASLTNAIARRLPVGARCLQRSLVAWWLLRRRGIHTELRFGVRSAPSQAFHAWLELDGDVINDHPLIASLYAPFTRPITPTTLDQFDL